VRIDTDSEFHRDPLSVLLPDAGRVVRICPPAIFAPERQRALAAASEPLTHGGRGAIWEKNKITALRAIQGT
jgi:hypothetical protein